MTPLERFNGWLSDRKGLGMTYFRVRFLAEELGYNSNDMLRVIHEIRHWLAANEDNKKANKKFWGKFMLNWLKPKSSRQGRLEPSDFDGK